MTHQQGEAEGVAGAITEYVSPLARRIQRLEKSQGDRPFDAEPVVEALVKNVRDYIERALVPVAQKFKELESTKASGDGLRYRGVFRDGGLFRSGDLAPTAELCGSVNRQRTKRPAPLRRGS